MRVCARRIRCRARGVLAALSHRTISCEFLPLFISSPRTSIIGEVSSPYIGNLTRTTFGRRDSMSERSSHSPFLGDLPSRAFCGGGQVSTTFSIRTYHDSSRARLAAVGLGTDRPLSLVQVAARSATPLALGRSRRFISYPSPCCLGCPTCNTEHGSLGRSARPC